jgi:subtilase family serine protease
MRVPISIKSLCCFLVAFTLSACGGGNSATSEAGVSASPTYHAVSLNAVDRQLQSRWVGTGIGSTLSPTDMSTHYNYPAAYTGAGQTIAIVDAPGSGNIANDLNTFSNYYRLPVCNTSNPCFQKIDLSNGAAVSPNNDWADEIGLDVEWAHAMAPAANIILVLAKSSSMADMMSAIKTAASQPGVVAVSMSWGAYEYSSETSTAYDGLFASYPSIVFFASSGDSGDNGSNQIYPAASPYVTAVGGTSIKILGTPTAATEVAWSLGGGGASIYENMPVYQTSFLSSTTVGSLNHGKRAIPDVAYDADLNYSPVGVYVNGGWYAIGGTSAGSPQWAAIIARFAEYLQGKGSSFSALVSGNAGFNNLIYQAKIMQASKDSFYDVTVGSDNTSRRRTCALCNAVVGYDDVTGLGVPDVGIFFGFF